MKQQEEKTADLNRRSEVIETGSKEPDTKTEVVPTTTFETYSEIEVTQHSLVVEIFPVNITIPGTKKKSDIEPQHAISHYFSSQALPKSDKDL